jgi:hypothetical protein
MKHMKALSKKAAPARASILQVFFNMIGKPQAYVDLLWESDDSVDPEDLDL